MSVPMEQRNASSGAHDRLTAHIEAGIHRSAKSKAAFVPAAGKNLDDKIWIERLGACRRLRKCLGVAMKLPRRGFLHLASAATALTAMPRVVMADTYPSRPVRLIVGFPAGYATDIVARLVAQSLSERVGQQVFVENHPGAATNIAAEEVINAAPDGYTLLAMTVTNAVNATLYNNLKFNIVHDIAAVVATFRSPNVLVVTPTLPAKTLPEFIAYAKANPGKINYASAGYGSAPNVNAELFKMMAGVDLVHVPYSGSFVPDLLSGQVQCAFPPIPLAIANIRAGKLRALAVTSATRSDALPGVPAVAEFVPGFEASIWHGIGAPKKTPVAIINRLNHQINAVLADPKVKERFADVGGAPLGGSPADFHRLIADEIAKWGKVIRIANINPA
jgi:tripartite-type tricarboxylate transporter receptor subunit TctC